MAMHWHEIAWPFPRDGWPAGRAFRCDAAGCGAEVELYVRPKIGFCNCDSGVADDDEVDRVADLDLMSDRFVPREAGQVIQIDGMSGRSRSYDLRIARWIEAYRRRVCAVAALRSAGGRGAG